MIKKLLYLSNLIFLSLYFILAWNNRFVNDDFCSIVNLHHYGIFKGTEVMYNAYCTRWISVLFVHVVLNFIPQSEVLFLVGVITIIAITFSFCYLLRNVLSLFLHYSPGKSLLLNLGIFSVNAFFYSTIDIGTTWFWLSSLPTYLWSFIFFMLGCGIVLSVNRFRFQKDLILSLSFFYIGGSSETFAAVVLLLLFFRIIILYLSKLPSPEKKMYTERLFLAFIFCFCSFLILYAGHGNVVRRSILGEISLLRAFALNIKTTGWIGLHWLSKILPFILLFSLPLIYTGKIISLKNSTPIENLSQVWMTLFKAVILYGILVFILNYPITYLLCGISPARALVTISFMTWALFSFSFFYLGYKTTINETLAKNIAIIALVVCLLLNGFNTVNQYLITGKYAQAYDTLMSELINKKDSISVISVSPLPSSGMLPSVDISNDSTANYNMSIKQSLGLKADIMLSK